MKTDISYLPEHKQKELDNIVKLICQRDHPEMIILFGSYARGTWVEDKFDEIDGQIRYRYQSDFDILVIVETNSEFAQTKIERDLEDSFEKTALITTPVSVIVHDIEFVNKRLKKAQYFFTDIKKEGIMLYNSKNFQLTEAKEIPASDRKRLAEDDFDYYFEKATEFYENHEFSLSRGKLNTSAFLLHQVVERLYAAILLVFTRYKPATHDIAMLRKLVNTLDDRFVEVFPMHTLDDKHLFNLLKKAYVDARYKRSYTITHDQLKTLANYVTNLRKVAEVACREKMDSFL